MPHVSLPPDILSVRATRPDPTFPAGIRYGWVVLADGRRVVASCGRLYEADDSWSLDLSEPAFYAAALREFIRPEERRRALLIGFLSHFARSTRADERIDELLAPVTGGSPFDAPTEGERAALIQAFRQIAPPAAEPEGPTLPPCPTPEADCEVCGGGGVHAQWLVGEGVSRAKVCDCVKAPPQDPTPVAPAGSVIEWGGARVTFQPAADPNPVCPRCNDSWRVAGSRRCLCRRLPDRIDRYNAIDIPARYVDATFATWDPVHRGALLDLARVQRWVASWTAGARGWVLCSAVGRGKTHLMCAALREMAFTHGAHVRFVEFSHLIAELKATFDRDARTTTHQVMARLLDCDVLAIDELGKGNRSDWELSVIDELISRAYNERRTVIATTNYRHAQATGKPEIAGTAAMTGRSLAEGQHTLGDRIGVRTMSRLFELADPWTMGEHRADHRGESARTPEPMGESTP